MISTITPPTEKLITGEELMAMGDIGPCELIDGRIVMIDATGDEHGGIEVNVTESLSGFVRPRKLGKVRGGEVGIYIKRNPDRVRAADALFISLERWMQRQNKQGYLDVAPELVVEVLSPDDRMIEVNQKLGDYFSIGVKIVWVIDPESKIVYAYRSLIDVHAFTVNDTLTAEEVLSGYAVAVASLFEV